MSYNIIIYNLELYIYLSLSIVYVYLRRMRDKWHCILLILLIKYFILLSEENRSNINDKSAWHKEKASRKKRIHSGNFKDIKFF